MTPPARLRPPAAAARPAGCDVIRNAVHGIASAAKAVLIPAMNPETMLSKIRRSSAPALAVLSAITLSMVATPATAAMISIEPATGLNQIEPTWTFSPTVLDVEPSDSIENVLAKIANQDPDVVIDRAFLSFDGLLLDQGRTLADYDIRKNAVLVLGSSAQPTAHAVPEPSTAALAVLACAGLLRRQFAPCPSPAPTP